VTDDPIAAALHAEAEEARTEIRAAGIVCPSCGVNMADLPQDHKLVLDSPQDQPAYVKCADGERVSLRDADYEAVRAAMNVGLVDEFRASIPDLTQPARLIYPTYPSSTSRRRYTAEDALEGMLAVLEAPRYSPYFGTRPPPPPLPSRCYQSEYGFTVHIRGACECG
jgi:hypothetical protein